MKTDYFECTCFSPEHRLVFHYDNEFNEIYADVFLSQYNNFFKRIWVGIKYIFGYKCKYGHFDCFILEPDDKERLIEIIKQLKLPGPNVKPTPPPSQTIKEGEDPNIKLKGCDRFKF